MILKSTAETVWQYENMRALTIPDYSNQEHYFDNYSQLLSKQAYKCADKADNFIPKTGKIRIQSVKRFRK